MGAGNGFGFDFSLGGFPRALRERFASYEMPEIGFGFAFPFFNLAVVGHTSAGRSLAPLWDRHQVTQAISLRYGYRPRELTLQV